MRFTLRFLPQNVAACALFVPATIVGLLTALLFLAAPSRAMAKARKIELGDLQKIVNVSSPQISPDGKSIVVIVSRVNWDEDRYDSRLVLVDIVTGAQRPLTNIRKGLDSPQWSPSGDRLAFLAEAGEEKKAAAQIFVLPMNGGEANQITSVPLGIEQFAWRPDGGFIAFSSPDEPPNKADIEKHHDLFEVGDNSFLDTSAPTPSHLWLIPASGGTAKRLTSGAWSLSKNEDNLPSSLSWSPDGKQICFTRQADPHVGDSDQTVLEILDVDSGQIRQLTNRSAFESFGLFSPDGSKIAYWFPRDGDFNSENEIFVAPSTGGDGTDLTRALDRDVSGAIWMPDGKSLLVNGDDGTRTVIWIQPLDGAARKVDLGEVNPTWDALMDANAGKDGSIAFAGSTPTQPAELYYLASPEAKLKRLTDFNHEIATLDLGHTDTFEWRGPDGFAEDGVVVYPPNFSRDKKYPLVLLIHGGPADTSTTGLVDVGSHTFLAQLMASHGYVVFEPNFRGSDNLGNKYQLAIVKDSADGPGRDIMAGIAALEKQGFIDESRIGVSGWSYGGYLTSWLISQYHIWKTAVSGQATNNRADAYNLSDHGIQWRFMFGGSPWKKEHAKTYEEQSPITYAGAITTPTLILHDTGDRRVPITNAYALYHALKDNGVTVKFIAVPVAAHFPYGNPVHESDICRVWLDWLDQYLK
ncbi:MAG: S9 family peptidase [Candidatus Sulfotelmatobacter sp.]